MSPLDGEPFRGGDWKPGKEAKAKPARSKRAPLQAACVSCGRAANNRHHVVQKGSPHFGEDVPENLAPLCGTGTTGCHGAFHGSPWTDPAGKKWTAKLVGNQIGLWVVADERRLDYVLGRAGAEYLRRFYGVK